MDSNESVGTGNATFAVRFSKFWSTSKARNSFDLARRGELRFSGENIVVRAFRREMLFMGTRIELTFRRAEIVDVLQSGDFVSFRVAPPNQAVATLQFWAKDERNARLIADALPKTLSAAGLALKEYQAQLAQLSRGDWVTKALVSANVLVFGVAGIAGAGFFVPNAEVLQSFGTNIGPWTTTGEWWRLVTSMFLHFGVFHLAFNMWALYIGGQLAERLFGSRAYALLYFASGIAGSLGSLLWNPAINSAGASGAIFGVYGAMLAFFLRKHSAIPPAVISQQRWSGVFFIGFNLMNGFSHTGIDNAAHLGGLGVGFLLGLVLAKPFGVEGHANAKGDSSFIRGVGVALALIGTLFVALHFSPAGNVPEQKFRRDIILLQESEQKAQVFAQEAFAQAHNRQITPKEFADRLEKDVLPRWQSIHKSFEVDTLPDKSKLEPLRELLEDYSKNRLAGYELFASGARNNRTEDYRQAGLKMDQAETDLKLMRTVEQSRQP